MNYASKVLMDHTFYNDYSKNKPTIRFMKKIYLSILHFDLKFNSSIFLVVYIFLIGNHISTKAINYFNQNLFFLITINLVYFPVIEYVYLF